MIEKYWKFSSKNFMTEQYDDFIADNKIINELNENVLYTFELGDVIKIFKKYGKIKEWNKDLLTFKIQFDIFNDDINFYIDKIKHICHWSGWIVSYIIFDGKILNNFNKIIESKNKKVSFICNFRPKHEVEHNYKSTNKLTNDIYDLDYIYHITDRKYVKKILKNGLLTRTKNKLGNYPEVNHFLTEFTHKGPVAKIIKNDDNEYSIKVDPKMQIDDPVILKIYAPYCKQYNIKFSYDPAAAKNCVISYNSIPPNLIEIVNKNEYKIIYDNQLDSADYSMLR